MNRRELLAGITALAAVRWSPALAVDIAPADQAKLIANVDAYAARMSQVALQIWAAPEVGYQEFKTTALLQSELRNAGFKVEAGVAEIPTAFVARAGSNDGPVIAILAEMDSLPGLSQEAVPERKPIAGEDSGHACGHNLFGSGTGFWNIGAGITAPIFDGGTLKHRQRAAEAAYRQAAEQYRSTVLTAFQNVENDLAGLRILAQQADALAAAVRDAKRGTEITLNEYQAGTVDYTTVAVAQTTQLNDEQTALNVQQQRLLDAASLIGDLGGGWSADTLHDPRQQPQHVLVP